jgi:uncharacterized RDD family membrane protein YckC
VTLPPPDQPPAIPGASAWTTAQPPTFIARAPSNIVPAQFQLAGWGTRLAAYTIDQILRLVLAIALAILGFVVLADDPFSFNTQAWEDWAGNEASPLHLGDAAENNLLWLLASAAGLYVLLAVIYAPLFMAVWRGATPGKRLVGIRVVRDTGADITIGTAFIREPLAKGLLINVIGGSFVLVSLLSYLWPLWDRECRAGHDFIARTRVVKSGA